MVPEEFRDVSKIRGCSLGDWRSAAKKCSCYLMQEQKRTDAAWLNSLD